MPLDKVFDKLRRAVADDDMLLMDVEVARRQQAVDTHPGRILCQQALKARPHFIYQLTRREIRVHKIAEIQHRGVSPVSAVAGLKLVKPEVVIGKHGFRDVQILNVVYLVPALSVQLLRLYLRVVKHCYDPQHLLIVLVVAERHRIRVEERDVPRLRKMLAELIDVYGLIIVLDIVEIEVLARNKRADRVVLTDFYAGSVHPALVFVHKRKRLTRVVDDSPQDAVLKYDV